jgi:hypothetical protein
MRKGFPFHSNSPELTNYVYHDHPNCTEAKKIKLVQRRPGIGGRPYCDECRKLYEAESNVKVPEQNITCPRGLNG